MTRRRILIAAGLAPASLAALLCGRAANAQQPASAFAPWVRGLYEREVARHAALARGERTSALADADHLELFTAEVRALIRDARDRAMPSTEPAGPILHTFFGWGALPGRDIVLVAVTDSGPVAALVDITVNGALRRLVVAGRYDHPLGRWRIADIHYGAGPLDQSYVARLRRMATWSKRR
jgi:hypothetical protein